MPATTSVAFTKARVSTWAPVNTTKPGATAEIALVTPTPAKQIRIRRRRPCRSASALATSETSTPPLDTANASPRPRFEAPNVFVTESAVWPNSAPPKFARAAMAATVASSAVARAGNGTGGRRGDRFGGGGGGRPSTSAADASTLKRTGRSTCGMLRPTFLVTVARRAHAQAEARRHCSRVRAPRPRRQDGEAEGLPGQEGRRVLLPESRHARLHDTSVLAARRGARSEEAEGEGRGHQSGYAGEAKEVRRQVRTRVPAARRREPQGRASLGDVGQEVPLRTVVHGHHPLRVRRRREGQGRRRLLQDQPEGHRAEGD